jgi:PEP-CTERM motif
MRLAIRPTVILAVAVWLSGVGTPAHAGSLNPNLTTTTPIPAGYTNVSAGNPKFIVNATPDPAVFIPNGNGPWLLPALSAEGFAKVDQTNPRGYSGANGWTINFVELSQTGSFTRQVYYPWAAPAPAYSLNGLNSAARNNPGNGGDRFSLTYTAGAGDPTGASAEWIQVIKANDATATEKMYGYNAGGGYTYFLDNFYGGNTSANNGTMNPTYDGGYTITGTGQNTVYTPKGYLANPTAFIDTPNSPLTNGLDDEFQVFLAKDNTTTKTLTIYDGVWWGYQAVSVPEPSTWILLVSGCGIVAFARRRDLRARQYPLRGGHPSLRG